MALRKRIGTTDNPGIGTWALFKGPKVDQVRKNLSKLLRDKGEINPYRTGSGKPPRNDPVEAPVYEYPASGTLREGDEVFVKIFDRWDPILVRDIGERFGRGTSFKAVRRPKKGGEGTMACKGKKKGGKKK